MPLRRLGMVVVFLAATLLVALWMAGHRRAASFASHPFTDSRQSPGLRMARRNLYSSELRNQTATHEGYEVQLREVSGTWAHGPKVLTGLAIRMSAARR